MRQYPAKMFLAERQMVLENGKARTVSVFGGRNGWFGNLYVVNDETLAPGFPFEIYSDESTLIILPIVGDLNIVQANKEKIVSCGEAIIFSGRKTGKISINNLYETELINFLQIRVHSTGSHASISRRRFDLNNGENEMTVLLERSDVKVCIGKFNMRGETDFICAQEGTGVFCFVIQGSLEIEGRLLHHRDGLAIWDASEIEIESLGKESILLLVEVPVG